jgi:hypothetical protein
MTIQEAYWIKLASLKLDKVIALQRLVRKWFSSQQI